MLAPATVRANRWRGRSRNSTGSEYASNTASFHTGTLGLDGLSGSEHCHPVDAVRTYRPDPRRVPRAEAMTPWTAARERRNSRAIAAGLNPASWAARINRSCPGVTPAAPADAPAFARVDFAGPGLPGRGPLSESSGISRPRRRASSVTAFVSRSSCSSSSRRSDFPRSAGRARHGTFAGRPMSRARDAAPVVSARDPPIPVVSRRVIVPDRSRFPCIRSPRARKAFTVSGADGRKDNRYGFPP